MATVRCRNGRREYGGERAGGGAEVNRSKSEINRKSTTFLTHRVVLYDTEQVGRCAMILSGAVRD
jgi:hypothetical protein